MTGHNRAAPDTRLPSIRVRLTRSLIWLSLLTAALMSVLLWLSVGEEMDELMNHELQDAAEIARDALAVLPDDVTLNLPAQEDPEYEKHLVWQVVADGKVLRRSHHAPEQAILTTASARVTRGADSEWLAIALPFRESPGRLMIVAQSVAERAEAHREIWLYVIPGTLGMSLLAILIMNWRIRRELDPLIALSEEVARYDPLAPTTAPAATGRKELRPIELSVRELGERLGRRIVSERAFGSHAAHALRTPVAGIDAQLAIALKEAPEDLRPRLRQVRTAATRLGRVMQALLMMFRSGVEPQRRQATLSELLPMLSYNDLDVSVEADAPFVADPDLLLAALQNLLDNSQRHHARRAILGLEQSDGWTRLRLEDDGEGCSHDRVQRMRDSLDRQDYSPGSGLGGLGLILADLVMRAHGGRARLIDSSSGFIVELGWPS